METQMPIQLLRLRNWIPVAMLAGLTGIPAGLGQTRSPSTPSIRLYVFDMGTLKSANPQPLLDRGIKVTDMSVSAYLVVHPQGLLLFDSGVIPDELIKPEGTTEARATAHKTLFEQLAQIGYKPSDITYLALSHNHYDHIANANEFALSTWLAQQAERAVMFPEKPPEKQNNAAIRFSALRNAKTKLLDGDYDVFGDGSVVLLLTPGHTPGHQCLYVKLRKTGGVVLSGDLYHYPAERTLKDFNPYGGKTSETELASRARIEAFLQEHHAQIWIGHDILQFAKLKKSPQYYQ
jgi:glyoxylase-like metal-dependent hydrolase (beta-lactamase superfamily II)